MNQSEGKIPVRIHMKTAINDQGNQDTIESQSTGVLFRKQHTTYIRYEEHMEHVGDVSTIVKMSGDDEVTIIRQGAVSMRQQFIKGKTTESKYRSPVGLMDMKATTKALDYRWSEQEGTGELTFSYLLQLQGQQAGKYSVTINLKEDLTINE